LRCGRDRVQAQDPPVVTWPLPAVDVAAFDADRSDELDEEVFDCVAVVSVVAGTVEVVAELDVVVAAASAVEPECPE
jgi:hypothetical protein